MGWSRLSRMIFGCVITQYQDIIHSNGNRNNIFSSWGKESYRFQKWDIRGISKGAISRTFTEHNCTTVPLVRKWAICNNFTLTLFASYSKLYYQFFFFLPALPFQSIRKLIKKLIVLYKEVTKNTNCMVLIIYVLGS